MMKKPLIILGLLVALTACHKHPTANIPDTPLEKPLDIIIEPKKVAMTRTWVTGIKEDGTLWTWGGTQGNISTGGFNPTPKQAEGINDVVAVSASGNHTLFLKKDGTVWGWGSNYDGEIDPTDKASWVDKPRQIQGLVDIVDMTAGNSASHFLNKKGEVYTIGGKSLGWVNGINEPLKKPTQVPNLTDIVRIEDSSGALLALNSKGEIYTTGDGSLGRAVQKVPKDKPPYYPAQKVDLPRKVVDMSISVDACMVLLDNGEVWAWGDNSGGRLALPKGQHPDLPTKHPYLRRIVNIGSESAVDAEGNLYVWGAIGYGDYNAPSQKIYRKPIKIAENISNPALLVQGGGRASGVLTKDGNFYAWGWFSYLTGNGGVSGDKTSHNDVLTVQKSLFTTY